MADVVQNDVGVNLLVTCYDQNGNVIDLTSAISVSLQFYIGAFPPIYTRSMTVVTPAKGLVQYTFGTYIDINGNTQYDLGVFGTLYFRVVAQFSSSVNITSWGSGEISVHKSFLE